MIIIAILIALMWDTAIASTLECPVSTPESFQLTISGRRNETGHWIAQVSMEHNEDMTPWEVDVKKIIKNCSGSKSVLLAVTVSEASGSLESLKSTLTATPVGRNTSSRLEMALRGYIYIPPFGYYKFYAGKKDWNTSKKKCEQEGAHLVIFNSREEFDSVKAEYSFSSYIHIGFHDKNEEGKYITVQGDFMESSGYLTWRSGHPEDSTSKNCGYINVDGEMGVENCDDNEQFVCEV